MEIRENYDDGPWTIAQWEAFLQKARTIGAENGALVYVVTNETAPYIAVDCDS